MTTLLTFLAILLAAAGPAKQTEVTFLQAGSVDQAFEVGRPLIEESNYKVHASRRVEPGEAEVHLKDTDILYVLGGTAVVVTGGTTVQPRSTAAEEIRGSRIEGGLERRLVKGDFMIVPSGVPHWFKEVQGPFLYYVVKVRQESGGPS